MVTPINLADLKVKNLLANHTSDLEEQATHLNKRFEEWRGDLDQVDDVCVIGVRL